MSQLQAHKYSMGEASVDIHLYISAGSECRVRPQNATRKCLKSMGCSLFPRYQRTKSQDPASGNRKHGNGRLI
jgi:hypothetical protein